MRSAFVAGMLSKLLERWLKTDYVVADIVHVPIKLVPKVQLANQMAPGKGNSWRKQYNLPG